MKCCDITAGKLRQSVTIQQIARTPDGVGGYTETWNDVATVRGMLTPMSGGERVQAMKLESTLTHKLVIRYRSDLGTAPTEAAAKRIKYGSRTFQVRAVWDIEERKRWMRLDLEEGVADFGS